ncbi:MAG: glutamine synthetase [Candidatus Cloacimonetes bacterium 4572_55]|nr:MAG: glutamine synthetase [Candidatus Cloacimonetes bacterium 4572_55]
MYQSYELENPLSKIIDKPRENFTREDLIHVIEKENIERITFHYTALDGKLKELKLPFSNRHQAERILAEGERVDGSSLFKGMVDVSVSDLYVVPLYKTAFLNPLERGSLDFVCRYLTKEGELAPFALDTILHRANTLFRERTNLEFYTLGELEFYLISHQRSGDYPSPKQRGYHSAAPFSKKGRVLNEMLTEITKITGNIKYAHSEVGCIKDVHSDLRELKGMHAQQMEVEFLPAPVEESADNLVIARWMIRNIASRHGCIATFTPKLEEDAAGNGMHVHMQLRQNGKNVMTDTDGDLSEKARMMIGGLCHYADSLMAFGNTVSSAYLRLVPNQEAPTRVCWSNSNRSAMIRTPLGWSTVNNLAKILNPQQLNDLDNTVGQQTVEIRTPDGSAITHLLLAGLTAAAEWGLTHSEESLNLAKDLYVTGNIFNNKELLNKLTSLPQSCQASSRILLEKRELYERDNLFPTSIIDYMAKLLQKENDEFINPHLIGLTTDDRLHETRKIMHKDLHRH